MSGFVRTIAVLASFFGSGRRDEGVWVMCKGSFSSCTSLRTGLDGVANLEDFPSTATST